MLSPEQAQKAEAEAFRRAYGFAKNPEQLKHAGYATLEVFVLSERQRIEKMLQRWEAANRG